MKKLFVISLALIPFYTSAQPQLKELTLEDAVLERRGKLAPERIAYFEWVPGEATFLTSGRKEDSKKLFKATAPAFAQTELISLSAINQLLPKGDSISGFSPIKPFAADKLHIHTESAAHWLNPETKRLNRICDLDPSGEHLDFSPNGEMAAYTIGNNLYINMKDGLRRIEGNVNKDIVTGQAVARFEFGISKGTFWSPQNNYLAFYRNNQSGVTSYPLVDISKRPAEANKVKYPMAGMKSEEVTIGVYDVKENKSIFLKTGGPKEQYLTNVAWGPGEKFIYVAVVNRDQNHMKLNRYRVSDGSFDKTLFEEKDDKYVQPLSPVQFVPGDNDQFTWQSERDGYNHLYLYNTDGKLLKQLTSGEELVTDVYGFDEKGKEVLVQTTSENGLSRSVKWVNLRNGKSQTISDKPGYFSADASSSGDYILRKSTSLETPALYTITDHDGNLVKHILTPPDPLKGYKTGKTEIFQVETENNVQLNARLIKPHNFKESKKYPVLVYVYNGPNVQLVQNRWLGGAPLWMHYFANKGYLVFSIDGRGSENRGKEFEQVIFRQVGEVEIEDQLVGLNYLKNLGYVDTNRFAVHGWSYGGFMTTSLMLKTPGKFKVGVSGGGVMDWKYYEVMYTERYMDTPETNKEGYENASLLNKTQNLKGNLLIIHDSGDDVVVPQHAEDFIKSCVDNGVQVDFFWYPGHKHNVRGKDRVHLMEKVLTYIESQL